MERLIRIGFVLLVLSLILNIALFSRVGSLTDEMNNRFNMLNSEWQRISSLTQHNADRISLAVNTIETEQRWITPVTIIDVKQVDGNAEVRLSWVIKDYREGAPVNFHYRKQGDTQFVSQSASSMGDGRFEVKLTEKLDTEPKWKIGITYFNGKNGDRKASIASEAIKAERPNIMEYYITVKDGTRLKNSEIMVLELSQISEGIYAPLSTEVQIDRERETYLLFLTQGNSNPKQAKLARAFLVAYNGKKQLIKKQLTLEDAKPDDSVQMFRTEWNYSGQSFTKVFLKVEYENGKHFEKEIT